MCVFFFFKQKTAYEMRISDWSSDVCSSDLIAFLAAIAGAFIGRAFIAAPAPVENELHSLLHHNLKLDRAQQTQMDEIERRFAIRRQALELELRADNARLADAIQAEHGYGPAVGAAIDRSHQAMGELQDRKST